jgi:hypothetical protein
VNGDDGRGAGVVDALLGDRVVRVRVVETAGDEMASVGRLDKLDLQEALATVGETAALVYDKLEHLTPTKAGVEFGISFAVQAGKLTALLFDGKADASLTISLEWERDRRPAAGVPSGT